ncbi:ADP-ribose pyrophosphatase [Streptacidiphilus pinicola]|uniref:ADP-ribose pyrophosphatase n=1 Tax=Streptacidiphilus pinicola TaxID=2219663 RepID=A0A2X0KHV3_9ACTN|nr:NUDIX hydrolase [Streptacidiphilus pinicola]RAG86340.1 ADP-ribose pyrophosphatase [Streptacidiphilus pinicola]
MQQPDPATGWELVDRQIPFTYRLGHIRKDRLRIAEDRERTITVLENAGAVYVVPVTAEGEVVLIRQYRYTVDDWVREVPAGGLFDHDGDLASLAVRELREETGGEAEEVREVGWFYDSVPISTSRCHVFLARGVRLAHVPRPGATELIRTELVPVAEAMAMARDGRITDGRSALALLRCEPLLTEAP